MLLDFVVMLVSGKISGKTFYTRVQNTFPKQKQLIPSEKKLNSNLHMCSNGGCSMERESNHLGGFQMIDPIKETKKELSPSFGESSIDEE